VASGKFFHFNPSATIVFFSKQKENHKRGIKNLFWVFIFKIKRGLATPLKRILSK
jgi:hypothetical protein